MKRVLIVDDEKEFLLIIGQKLKDAGFSIIAATDGKGALSLAKKERPDAIVLDIVLPDIDGIEVDKKLKEDPETKDIPIIFISGLFVDKEAEEKGHVIEGRVFLQKPFKIKDLVAEINKLT